MNILILNGPNLNLLGTREPDIYGNQTMQECLELIKKEFSDITLHYFQSNSEGAIIDKLQEITCDGLIINPGAYTHYSYAIADALKSVKIPIIEVHISNIYNREEFRQKSVTAPFTDGLLSGFGMKGYRLAVLALLDLK